MAWNGEPTVELPGVIPCKPMGLEELKTLMIAHYPCLATEEGQEPDRINVKRKPVKARVREREGEIQELSLF